MEWKVFGTMVTDCEEKVDGMKNICTVGGDFVGFVMPEHAALVTSAPKALEILDLLRETIRLNEADMKPGIFNYLNNIIERVLPDEEPEEAPAEEPERVDGLTYDEVKYNVYAFGCDVRHATRKRDAARKAHTRAAYERERASAQHWLESNQQRLTQFTG